MSEADRLRQAHDALGEGGIGRAQTGEATLDRRFSLGPAMTSGAHRLVRTTSAALGGATLAIGATGLLGWMIGSDILVRVRPGFAAMPPSTGIALIALGCSLLLIGVSYRGRWRSLVWRALTWFGLVIGASAVLARTLGMPSWTGPLVSWDGQLRTTGTVEALPSLGVGASLVLVASALLLGRGGRWRQRLSSTLLMAGAAIAGVALNAHALVSAEDRRLIGPFAEMSMLGSTGVLLAALGGLIAGGERGLMALIWRDSPGGWLARRVLPGLLLLPGVMSRVVHTGTTAGVYSVELERSLIVVAVTIAIVLVFWNASVRIDEVDAGRRAAEHLSTTDPLTGLANRRGLEGRLAGAQQTADGRGASYAIVALDADGLKRVNDTLGHEAGDAVIRAIGQGLRTTLRPLDLAARVGGDEFLVLLAPATESEASQAARRIGTAVNRRLAEPRFGGVTVSTGVATWSPGLGPAAVIAAADRKLYEAKRVRTVAAG